MKKNFALSAVIAVLFASVGLYFGNLRAHAEVPEPASVHKLFATKILNLNNQPQALSQWKGKMLLVNFWATWCTPCVKEMPEMSTLQIQNKAGNFQIIGIGIDSASNIQEFSSKYKISYPIYVGGTDGSALLRDLGDEAGGLPFSVLIGPNGQIKKTYLGRLKMDEVKRDLSTP